MDAGNQFKGSIMTDLSAKEELLVQIRRIKWSFGDAMLGLLGCSRIWMLFG
jgi:hypothetical protein